MLVLADASFIQGGASPLEEPASVRKSFLFLSVSISHVLPLLNSF